MARWWMAALGLLVAANAQAEPVQDPEWWMPLDLRFRTQPLGVAAETSINYRNTYRRDGTLLFDGVYAEAGADLVLSPAFVEVGAHGEWLPLKILKLRLEYSMLTTFGFMGYMLSYPSADSPYGDAVEDAREDEEEVGIGHRFGLLPTLQFKVGPVVIQNRTNAYFYLLDGFEGPYLHERLYDRLVAQRDGVIANTSLVLVQVWAGQDPAQVLVGPMFEYATTVTDGSERMRIGGTAVVVPHPGWRKIQRPRIVLQVGYNLEDGGRQGAVFVQGGVGIDFWLKGQE